jgi:hypothetical protein
MSFTRIHDDPCRVIKQNQQSTDQGRFILNVPGNGDKPCYMEDPAIIVQKWGGNLWTNSVALESSLLGIDRQLSRDCLGKDDYMRKKVNTQPIQYPSCKSLTTEQSRAIMPAWTARDLEQVDWYTLPLDPQANVCMPFQNNLSTRILEKDYFVREYDCNTMNSGGLLPYPSNPDVGNYVGGPNTCSQTNSCAKVPPSGRSTL